MGISDIVFRIIRWVVNALISLAISIIILIGTLVAAYVDFGSGMGIFWAGCILTALHQGHRIYGMRRGVKNVARTYMGSALSLLLNIVFGYGGALFVYAYGTSARASNPLIAGLFPERAPYVFALTSAVYATVQILLALARSLMAYKFAQEK